MSQQTTAHWQHQFLTANGLRFHYVTQGTGPLMLCLHGFPEFWYSWRYQLPAFADYFTVVALDLRGYNDSDKPDGVSAYAMSTLIQDIAAIIPALGFERCILVGHDWGGAIAWHTAYEHPDQVEKLIIMNCPHPQRFLEGVQSSPAQWLRSAYIGFFQFPWLPELLIQANDYQFIEQVFYRMAGHRGAISATDIRAYKTAAAKPSAVGAALNYYRNLLNPALWQRTWPVLEVPTLMIWGEADPAFETTLVEGTEDFVRDFHLRYIPECGHWVPQEYPDRVNQYMAEFLHVPVPAPVRLGDGVAG